MLLSLSKSEALLTNLSGKSSSASIGSYENCWLGLLTTLPADDGTGAAEPGSGKNYARVEIHSLMSVSSRVAQNSDDIDFHADYDESDPSAATGADWGTIKGVGLFTSRTGNTMYAWGKLTQDVTVSTHNTLHIRKNKLKITLTEVTASASVSS